MKAVQRKQQQNFSTEKIDLTINALQNTLSRMAEISAEHRGNKTEPLSEGHFEIELVNGLVKPKIQEAIDTTRKELLVAAEALSTKEFIQKGEQQIDFNNTAIRQRKSRIVEMNENPDILPASKPKKNIGTAGTVFLEIICWMAIVVDAIFGYKSFRENSLSTEKSIALTAFLIIPVIFTKFLFVPWVKRGFSKIDITLRALGVMAGMAILFYFLSSYRTNQSPSISVANPLEPVIQVNTWPQFIISYIVFLLVFFLYLFRWKASTQKKEQKKEVDSEQLLYTLHDEIRELIGQNKKIEEAINEKKNNLRSLSDYYHKTIQILTHIGDNAIARYKQTYAGYVKAIPDFFRKEHVITYDTDLNFITPKS
jgi:hypothetical protein